MKPLSPLETRCYAALQAFQEQNARRPSLRELTEASAFERGSQTNDVLHRLVCKGWLDTDKLPAEPKPPTKAAETVYRRTVQQRTAKPKAPAFVPVSTGEPVSKALVRAIDAKIAAGMPIRELRHQCGVQHTQIAALRRSGFSLRTPALDSLSDYLKIRLEHIDEPRSYRDCRPSEALRQAIQVAMEPSFSLNAICRSAGVQSGRVGGFVARQMTLNLKTVDAICGVLGLELRADA